MERVLSVVLVALAVALVLLVVVVAAHGAMSKRALVRKSRRVEAVRPAVIALAAADDSADAATVIAPLRRAEIATLEEIAYEFLTKVRGAGREALVALLAERGVRDRALRRLSRPGAIGRARAAAVLGQIGGSAAIAPLADRLTDRDPEVRLVVARALGELGHRDVVPHLLGSLAGRRALPATTVTMWLAAVGPTAIEPLRRALTHRQPVVRATAIELLGRFEALGATTDLLGVLADDREIELRARAARALGRIGTPRAVPALRGYLARRDGAVSAVELRRAAVAALGDIADPGTAGVLAAALADPDHKTARGAARALTGLGPLGMTRLRAAAAADDRAAAYARETLALHELSKARRLVRA